MAYTELSIFVNQMLDQKGLAGVDSTVREQLVADLEGRIVNQINRALVEAIPSSRLADFEKIASSGVEDSKIQSFFAECGIDTQKITTDIMVQFKDLYLGSK